MSNGHRTPMVTWGSGSANTLNIAYLDNWSTYPQPREGSSWVQTLSGLEDAWITGVDYYLDVEARWIPLANSSTPLATGWDGSTGWRGFMEWAQAKNPFNWYPDSTNTGSYVEAYLVEPMQGGPSIENDGSKRVRLLLRSRSGSFEGY